MADATQGGGRSKAAAPAATPSAAAQGVDRLSFEQALAELEAIVSNLEKGNVPLEESIASYERGEALKARCEALLRAAEARVDTITRDADGRPVGTQPLDPEG